MPLRKLLLLTTGLIVLSMPLCRPAAAQFAIDFPDPNFEAAVREAIPKPSGPIYAADCEKVRAIYALDRGINDLTGIECLTEMTELVLAGNAIDDLEPVRDLTKLYVVLLQANEIRDVSPLSGLTEVVRLELWANQIEDASPLGNLTSLTQLSIADNRVGDLGFLSTLTSLQFLWLSDNAITDISALPVFDDLWSLWLDGNPIPDISPLAGRTDIGVVNLRDNPALDCDAIQIHIPALEDAGVKVRWNRCGCEEEPICRVPEPTSQAMVAAALLSLAALKRRR